jgi:hypothetical protein
MQCYIQPELSLPTPRPPAAHGTKRTKGGAFARRKLMAVARSAVVEAAEAEDEAEQALCAATTKEERDQAMDMLQEAAAMAADAECLMQQAEAQMRRRHERASPPTFSPSPPPRTEATQPMSTSTDGSTASPGESSGISLANGGGRCSIENNSPRGRVGLHSLTGSTPRRTVSNGPLQPISASTVNSSLSIRSMGANVDTSGRSTQSNLSVNSSCRPAACPPKVNKKPQGALQSSARQTAASKASRQHPRANEAQFEVHGQAMGNPPVLPSPSTVRSNAYERVSLGRGNLNNASSKPLRSSRGPEIAAASEAELMAAAGKAVELTVDAGSGGIAAACTEWECALCTKANSAGEQACVVCGRSRGHLAPSKPTRRALRHEAAVHIQAVVRGRSARHTVAGMRSSQMNAQPARETGPVRKEARVIRQKNQRVVEKEEEQEEEQKDEHKDEQKDEEEREREDQPAVDCSWSHPDVAADFNELNAVMERLQQQIPDSDDSRVDDVLEARDKCSPLRASVTARGKVEDLGNDDEQQEDADDDLQQLNVTIENARRVSIAADMEARRLASAAKDASARALNESIAWEDAHEKSAIASEAARRLSVEARQAAEAAAEAVKQAAAEEAEARRLSAAARDEAVARSKAEAAAARAAKREAKLAQARKEAAAAAAKEQALQARKKKMEEEQAQAKEAAEAARKRATAAAEREKALRCVSRSPHENPVWIECNWELKRVCVGTARVLRRKQQEERVKKLRQDEVESNKIAADKQALIVQLDRKLKAKLAGCSGPSRFIQVLRVFGVAMDSSEASAVQKAYRKALIMFHPDKAQRKGASWQKVAEAEEIYKLIQNEYQQVRNSTSASCQRFS